MKGFVLGVLAGVGMSALAIAVRREYVSKRQKWFESDRPTAVPARYRVRTDSEPSGSATVRTYHVRPRKRPE